MVAAKVSFSSKGLLKSDGAFENDFNLENCNLQPDSSSHFAQPSRDGLSHNQETKKPDMLHDQRTTLEHDVAELQLRLTNESAVRCALEQAMGRSSSTISPGHRHHLTPQAKQLLWEISCLEEEVVDLEQHVLSLYRRFFSRFFSRSSSFFTSKHKINNELHQRQHHPHAQQGQNVKPVGTDNHKNFSVTSQISMAKGAVLTPPKSRYGCLLGDALNMARHPPLSKFQNLSAFKDAISMSRSNSLKEDKFQIFKDYSYETPNRLSEKLVHVMAVIYCKLCGPPLSIGPESPSSCSSSSTSMPSRFISGDGWSTTSQTLSDRWSPDCKQDTPEESASDMKGKALGLGAYTSIIEIPCIIADKERLRSVSCMLHDFRVMVTQLENVNPSQLKHDEKLAFWINIYNVLLMHAYLVYGIPRNNLKRMILLQRAAYKVGSQSFNAHAIEQCILGCRSHRPTQWLQNLLISGPRFKSGDERRMYAIDRPEPLVCFALCCGGCSDPVVRVYSAKNVHEELEGATREFIEANIRFQSDRRVVLPRILDWYAREASIASANLLEWVSEYVGQKEKDLINKCIRRTKPHKSASHCIEWASYSFSFRYLLDRDLVPKFSLHTM